MPLVLTSLFLSPQQLRTHKLCPMKLFSFPGATICSPGHRGVPRALVMAVALPPGAMESPVPSLAVLGHLCVTIMHGMVQPQPGTQVWGGHSAVTLC